MKTLVDGGYVETCGEFRSLGDYGWETLPKWRGVSTHTGESIECFTFKAAAWFVELIHGRVEGERMRKGVAI